MSNAEWDMKVWGRTRCVHSSQFYSIHELETVTGAYCSLHYHRTRANRFIVKSGHIQVIEMYGPKVERVNLFRDNIYDVPSLVPHMFVVIKEGVVIEEYYPDRGGLVRNDDIVRIVEGGKINLEDVENLPYLVLGLYEF
jgi:mannose-6-phosphate isomerase-like protein (cupin superfamily)